MEKAGPLVAFYRDGASDDVGRTLEEILSWSDERLEDVHDFIQWLFPLPERSGANPDAPILDAQTIEIFRTTPIMSRRLHSAFERMLRFYGFAWEGALVGRMSDFAARSRNWLRPMNHNHLRLTRILRSVSLLGLEAESAALLHALEAVNAEFPGRISPRTVEFWQNAARR